MAKITSCSIKYLKTAYIGNSVRLTGGKDTVKFENKPLRNVEIVSYDHQGFRLNHPDLPKECWLDFSQLPLKKLTLVNGIIIDEITFVENIVAHCTEFVKTDSEEYLMALSEFQLDSKIEFLSPAKFRCGDILVSGQCKESIELVYLGTFFSVEFIKTFVGLSLYVNNKTEKIILSDECLKRAYFIRRHEIEEANMNSSFLPTELKNHLKKTVGSWNISFTVPYEERQKLLEEKKCRASEEIKAWCEKENVPFFVEIIRYPITNKYVKEMMFIDSDLEYLDEKSNEMLINSVFNFEKFDSSLSKEFTARHAQIIVRYANIKGMLVGSSKKELLEKANQFLIANFSK